MRRYAFFAATVFAAAGITAFAQQPPASHSGQPTASSDKSVTVTGCLSAAPDQKTFTLSTAPSARGTSGETSGTSAPGAATITYTLTPSGSVDLKSHVGHTVQVTGTEAPGQDTVVSHTATEHGAAAAESTPGKQPVVKTQEQAKIVARQLTVSSVKMIAADCRVAK